MPDYDIPTQIVEVVARTSAAVESLTKNVDRLVEAQLETTRMLQEHIIAPNHAVGSQTLLEHANDIEDLKEELAELHDEVEDQKGNWKVVKVAGAIGTPLIAALFGAVAHLWFK